MKLHKLNSFEKGWFVGDFSPVIFRSTEMEVAIKRYKSGDLEPAHYHKVSSELTCVVYGVVRMNDQEFRDGDIVEVEPGEQIEFESITDSITVVVKSPSVKNDKYII